MNRVRTLIQKTLSNLHCLRVCTQSCHSQLIDYIIIVRLSAWPFYLCPTSLGQFFRQCSKRTSNFQHHIVCLVRQLWILRWHLIYGYNNLLLHLSLALKSSPIDYMFMKPLDKCVVIIITILTSSRISIECMMRNTIILPWYFVFSSTTSLPSFRCKYIHVLCCTLSYLLSHLCYDLP